MARVPVAAVSADFDEVVEHLKTVRLLHPAPDPDAIAVARRIHASTYALLLWKFRLKKLPAHGKPFVDEIASDALQILPQVMIGFSKTAKLLMRGVIENTLRHVYFSDHPVEFAVMNRDKKWYMEMKELLDYAKEHPDYILSEPKFDALAKLRSLYSELSGGVHGGKVSNLEMRAALAHIKFDMTAATKEAVSLEKVVEACNFMMAIFHREQLRRFAEADRRAILQSMSRKARQVYGDFPG
jgi:hypothetical protein